MDTHDSFPQSQPISPEQSSDIDRLVDQGFNYTEAHQRVGVDYPADNTPVDLTSPGVTPDQDAAIDKLVDNGGMNYTEARLRVLGTSPQEVAAPAMTQTVTKPKPARIAARSNWKDGKRSRSGMSPSELRIADEAPAHIRKQTGQ